MFERLDEAVGCKRAMALLLNNCEEKGVKKIVNCVLILPGTRLVK